MFERRLKIFLSILIVFAMVLVGRAMQLQLVQSDYWRKQAVLVMTRPELIETTRGRLLDYKGRVLAEDVACVDACVDYRAIPTQPNERWVRSVALNRLRNRMGSEYRAADKARRQELLEQEHAQVLTDIRIMWETLAKLGNLTGEQIEEIRMNIVRKVELRRRYVWYWKYQKALERQESREPLPWYQSWLIDDSQQAPDVDEFDVAVAEQTDAHVILRAISTETANYLGKNRDRFPGLVINPSMHRSYPYKDVGAHLIGRLSLVSAEDVANDPHSANMLRKYWPNDLIGRTGLESLCEPLLRGTRGRIERFLGENSRVVDHLQPVPGMDVQTTIDIELQRDIQLAFEHIVLSSQQWRDTLWMPGAAVVIDVPTGEVRAMVSYPSYDLNTIDENYKRLSEDLINRPLINRATQFALEPGSTVKTIVGLGAITQGILGGHGTIECKGFLEIGSRMYKTVGRCWVAKMYADRLGEEGVAHHPIPLSAPHPTGHLTFGDALERSCNVFFETLADRMGIEGLRYWFRQFGLGQPTGIGLPEVAGEVPGDRPIPAANRHWVTWFSGIGQSQVLATPVQLANVAATLARDGVWMRPRLVPAGTEVALPRLDRPERVDLKLSREALAQLHSGMKRVANGDAGTGTILLGYDTTGKTGSAQAVLLSIPETDEIGRPVMTPTTIPTRKPDGTIAFIEKLRRKFWRPQLGTHANPNPQIPWYRGTGAEEKSLSHAWYIGYAPADNPRIAFAVMVEYGGSGGVTAGQVARRILDACIAREYLPKR